ncbi:MAG: C4-dicarboxylic acid transporter DauA [Geothrix sp.]|uniref:C4-dicarboxylic acid transporter DauA n=1 Tax=Geothrix sp. TaxID=1962974 RepID=UPI00181B05D2|nr:C4-dicarboxylic acid transporter DauA [Geothrix sp.]NWJ41541.1 C4-dicarboxylic acid transporter DauA [Geothrix sp.]WIL20474.1 MAG: C4-dicarboxylic acid transporter DauA [Geothrix sp.]
MARTRFQDPSTTVPLRALPAAALRAVLAEGYSGRQFKRDLTAGFLVGIVALPLAMALAIAVGVPPQQGLYTAIIAGFITALLGGSRIQVAGPTAAFIVVLAPLYVKFGLSGLLMSGLLAGLMLIGMGLLRMGKLIEFIPFPVTTGFTSGIATVIAVLQVKDLFGLKLDHVPDHFIERLGAMGRAWHTVSPWELLIGLGTLAILLTPRLPKRRLARLPKFLRKIPAPLLALPLAALAAWVLGRWIPGFTVDTIGSRFHTMVNGHLVAGIPQVPPSFLWPWSAPGVDGQTMGLSLGTIRLLLPSAFAVAMLGAIESLLSAVVADGMARTRHDPDAELLALGVGNVIAPFFGGIPATGAIARTATNFRFGGRTPVAAMAHALTILLAILLLAPLISFLPMASLAALLLLVAWNMSEVEHFFHTVRVAPKSDVAVLLTCYFLTVVFDMVIAVTVGIVLASLLFMRRMASVSEGHLSQPDHRALPGPLPDGVVIYDLSGPLFFGAAERALNAMRAIGDDVRVIILRMEQVPSADVSGLVAMEGVLREMERQHIKAIFVGLHGQALSVFERGGLKDKAGEVAFCATMVEAFKVMNAKLHTYKRRNLGPISFQVLHREKARKAISDQNSRNSAT